MKDDSGRGMLTRLSAKWYVPKGQGASRTTVWEQTDQGDVLIARCENKNLPLTYQRANARLVALAPSMALVLNHVLANGMDDFAEDAIRMINRILETDNGTTGTI